MIRISSQYKTTSLNPTERPSTTLWKIVLADEILEEKKLHLYTPLGLDCDKELVIPLPKLVADIHGI